MPACVCAQARRPQPKPGTPPRLSNEGVPGHIVGARRRQAPALQILCPYLIAAAGASALRRMSVRRIATVLLDVPVECRQIRVAHDRLCHILQWPVVPSTPPDPATSSRAAPHSALSAASLPAPAGVSPGHPLRPNTYACDAQRRACPGVKTTGPVSAPSACVLAAGPTTSRVLDHWRHVTLIP